MRYVRAAIQWVFLAIAVVIVATVAVLTVELSVHLWRYGIYDGSRSKCRTQAMNVDDIAQCNRQPFE